jgi:hypothetical protein
VPTATFRVLFVFVVLSHARRRILHVNVTAHPTAGWTAQQIRDALPWDSAPRFLLRDSDSIYRSAVRRTVQGIGLEEVLTALPRTHPPPARCSRRPPARLSKSRTSAASIITTNAAQPDAVC